MKGFSIVRRSKNAINDLIENTAKLNYEKLHIGIIDGDRPHLDAKTGKPSGLTINQIAAINEFGTKSHPIGGNRVPARPFIGPVVIEGAPKYVAMIRQDLSKSLFQYKGGNKLLTKVGYAAKNDIRNLIKDGNFEPLSPQQVKKKGHAQPLYHTFQMYDAIGFEIRKK